MSRAGKSVNNTRAWLKLDHDECRVCRYQRWFDLGMLGSIV